MSIATIVTRGYGSFGTIPEVTLRGYSIGAVLTDDRIETFGVMRAAKTRGVFRDPFRTDGVVRRAKTKGDFIT